MIDPITLLATASAAFNGIKKAVAMGREAQDIFKQLSKWADSADQLYSYISKNADRPPGLFETISFKKSATSEALDLAATKLQLKQMEDDIRHMFFYGELQSLGATGYSEFIKNRKEIREKREKLLREQARRRAKFIESAFYGVIITILFSLILYMGWIFFILMAQRGKVTL
jgi:hypothetical protein